MIAVADTYSDASLGGRVVQLVHVELGKVDALVRGTDARSVLVSLSFVLGHHSTIKRLYT